MADSGMADSSTKRVLLFEDSDIFADMVLEYLNGLGYITERAVNGFEGIKKVYTFLPHLIITDVEMPVFKGYQATRLLKSRKNTRNIPVIMFTSLGETKDRFWGAEAGADWYIEKSPENFAELQIRIGELLINGKEPDFDSIKKEGARISDEFLIETVNNLLDRKLFQTTVIGMLTELSRKAGSLDTIIRRFFDLLNYVCEVKIASIMIKSSGDALFVYTANYEGFNREIVDDYTAITIADFNGHFPDFKVVSKKTVDIYPLGEKNKTLESYVVLPLLSAGDSFATVHIANTIGEYFSPPIMENLELFLNAAAPIIANALSMREMEELQVKTRTAFARYVPVDVMDEIIRKSGDSAGQSESRNLVVLFTDIRNFTTIAENNGAQDVVAFLNAFFSRMGNEIIAEGGHINKFIGDAIMAIFGAPKALPDAPAAALRAAVRMIAAMRLVDTSYIKLPEGGLAAGIGINYGECVVGNVGFQDKMDYTVIGDTVNLASRLEGVTKKYKHPLIVPESVYAAAMNGFIFRKADRVRVKGKDEPVWIYAVYAAYTDEKTPSPSLPETAGPAEIPSFLKIDRELLDNYNKGLQLFYIGEWKAALNYFNKVREIDGKDILTSLYLERIERYMQAPPPDDWDITTLTEK
jgi:class 3 adenylate cyclase/DNA-binding response OmpR family regulator